MIYSNDVKAARLGKKKFSNVVITKELFTRFKSAFPEYKNMVWKEFYGTWLEISERIRKDAVENPLGVKLGNYMGELKLQMLSPRFKVTDHSTSVTLGQEVKHLNIPTRGKVAMLKWERKWAARYNTILKFYGFRETRELNHLAKKSVVTNPDKFRTINALSTGISIWRKKLK